MGDTQTSKAADTVRIKQKPEDRPPPERNNVPRAVPGTTLLRAAASDDPNGSWGIDV